MATTMGLWGLGCGGLGATQLRILGEFLCLQLLPSQSTAEAYASLWYPLHHQLAFGDVVSLYEFGFSGGSFATCSQQRCMIGCPSV